MMAGAFREYNWDDILQLIYADAGLATDEDQRAKGEVRYIGNFREPEDSKKTCVRLKVYEKPFNDRIREHAGVRG